MVYVMPKHIWRLKCISLFLMLFICSSAFISCGRTYSPTAEDTKADIHTTDVGRMYGPWEYGDYVYFSMNRLTRFNRITSEIEFACFNEECDKTLSNGCPLDSPMANIIGVYHERLYFTSYVIKTTEQAYEICYQDLSTGAVTVLQHFNDMEFLDNTYAVFDGDYIYYQRRLLKENGNPTIPSDYEPCICRTPAEGGKEEIISGHKVDVSGTRETLLFVYNGNIITALDNCWYAHNVETGNSELLMDFNPFDIYSGARVQWMNGKAYCICGDENMDIQCEGDEDAFSYHSSHLYCIDLTTRELTRVVDEPIEWFCLTDEGIYYTAIKLTKLYDDPVKPENNYYLIYDPMLRFVDFDGNKREVISLEDYEIHMFTVINNVLYGKVYEIDKAQHRTDPLMRIGVVDLKTGHVTVYEDPYRAYQFF